MAWGVSGPLAMGEEEEVSGGQGPPLRAGCVATWLDAQPSVPAIQAQFPTGLLQLVVLPLPPL